MEKLCPLCNGLAELAYPCPTCGAAMKDTGALEDFRGPYSPYEEHYLMSENPGECLHLFQCTACGRDKRLSVPIMVL